MKIGVGDPHGKGMKWSTLGIRKLKVTGCRNRLRKSIWQDISRTVRQILTKPCSYILW